MNPQAIIEFIGTVRIIWWICCAVVILGLIIWRLKVHKEEVFEKREN